MAHLNSISLDKLIDNTTNCRVKRHLISTSGLQPGDLIILAARPSMGKTSFAINIAEHVAIYEHKPVAVFSMEMGAEQLAVRIVGSIGRINQTNLRTGRLSDDEWPRLTEAIERMRDVKLHIDETPGLTVGELRANSRRLRTQSARLVLRTPVRLIEPTAIPVVNSNYLMFYRIKPWVAFGAHLR